MGYPQISAAIPQPPQPQETITSVLGNAFERLIEIERRLCDLRDRIESRPQTLDKGMNTPVQTGTLHLSVDIRNTAIRILERCADIDSIL